MVALNLSKGKKRAYGESRASSSSLSPVPLDTPKVKKPKRAETRKCPVCDELIPLRLLAAHSELESERVEGIIKQVGSIDFTFGEPDDGPGPSSRARRSAIKARKSMSAMNPRSSNPTDTLEYAGRAIQTIKRHRKQRHIKLREMARDDDDDLNRWDSPSSGGIVCPICLLTVRGDQDVLDAHVDACLANESRRIEEARQREQELRRATEEDIWDNDMGGPGGNVDIRGLGFHTRDRHQQDVEDEVDVDGDDQTFGDAQFTEGDLLPVNLSQPAEEDIEIDIGGDSEGEIQGDRKTLRDLVAEGKVVRKNTPDGNMEAMKAKMEEVMGLGDAEKMDLAILAARKRGDKSSLIVALKNKVKQLESMRVSSTTSLLCRICLDPYDEPTVSTGCWHTCCRECWLRCLGSTKLCPICKRITGATDLRRIYL